VKPKAYEEEIRRQLIARVDRTICAVIPQQHARVHSFGSFASGLYLPTADMDLVLNSEEFARSGYSSLIGKKHLFKTANRLDRQGLSVKFPQVIAFAKVPIVKFTDKISNIKVDISFENATGLQTNRTLQNWKARFPAMLPLIAIIKQFLLMRNLNDNATGGLGGFSITCLVVSLLQHHPAIQAGSMIPEHHLGELLMDFFDLYGNKFNMKTTGIMMHPPEYFPKV
jgi:non-canonical poly(A) RNA polymerase PAPD5/7